MTAEQEFAPWRALGIGVILQALRDVRGPDFMLFT